MASFCSSTKKHYARLAAALDPRAHVIYTQQDIGRTFTVPQDDQWLVLSAVTADNIVTNSQNVYSYWNVREPDAKDPYVIGAGTSLALFNHYGETGSSIWTVQPSLVWENDTRYLDDPEELYRQRLDKIYDAPLIRTMPTVFGGTPLEASAPGFNPATIQPVQTLDWDGAPAPIGSERTWGVVRHAETLGGAWTALAGSDAANNWVGINLVNELDDHRYTRFTREFVLPFPRKIGSNTGFYGIKFAGGASKPEAPATDIWMRANGGIHWSIGPSLAGY
jgi:hypothetical protein